MASAAAQSGEQRRGGANASFAELFSAAVQARNLPLERIQSRLAEAGVPVSVATLSYWQTGRSKPRRAASLRAVAELESVLRLEPGQLLRTLATSAVEPWDPLSVFEPDEAARRAMADLGLGLNERWAHTAYHLTAVVDEAGHDRELIVRQTAQASCDGPIHWPVVFVADGTDPGCPVVVPTTAVQVGATRELPEQQMSVTELISVPQVRRGDWMMCEYVVQWPQMSVRAHQLEWWAPAEMRELVLQVRFLGAPPSTLIRRHSRRLGQSEPSESEPLTVTSGLVQAVIPKAAIGLHAISWTW